MEINGLIVLGDDDEEDQNILKPLLERVAPLASISQFIDGQDAIDYLRATDQRPFLTISEVGRERRNELELRRQIKQDAVSKRKEISFVVFTHPAYRHLANKPLT